MSARSDGRNSRREGDPPKWVLRVLGLAQAINDAEKPIAIAILCVVVPVIVALVLTSA